jgi:hypothetical protein
MKVELLYLNTANKPSPISEGVTEIQINSQPYKGINLTTRHTQARRAPRLATIHDVTKKPSQGLPHPSAVFHAYASADTLWVAQTLSQYTSVKRGKVSSNWLTHEATQFGDSICPVCVSTFQMLVQQCSIDACLNRHRRGLPPWSSEYQIRPVPFLSIKYSPFSPNCPPDLILNHSIIYSSSQYSFHEPGYQKALNLTSGVCHSTSTSVLSTKHSITNGFSTTIGSR